MWTPGMKLRPGEYTPYESEGSDMPGWKSLMKFVMIGVPIIGVAIIAACVGCCICCRRARRREKERTKPVMVLAERNREADSNT